MIVKVRYFGSLREITKRFEEHITLPEGATLTELLKSLEQRYGKRFSNYVFEKGRIADDVLISVNRRYERNLKRRLRHNDDIAIMPVVGGG